MIRNIFVALSASAWFLLLSLILTSCREKEIEKGQSLKGASPGWDRGSAESEFRQLQARMDLAKTEQTYLMIDMPARQLRLVLSGAVIWNCSVEFADDDSLEIIDFVRRFRGDRQRLVRPLADKHLFKASEKTPDSVLAIVGDVVKVDADLLQRELPERFKLSWGENLHLNFQTELKGKRVSLIGNAIEGIKETLLSPFGEAEMTLKVSPEGGLTLYRAAHKGMLTILIPPKFKK